MSTSRLLSCSFVFLVMAAASLPAQQPSPAPATPRTPRQAAAFDPTGYWVAVVTEDWRWRMVTPPKGDYTSIPLSDEGRSVADGWRPEMDGACQAYGAAGVMRIPTRLNIRWQGDDALSVDTDAGRQTRLLRFDKATTPGPRSLQGHSIAEWEPLGGPLVSPPNRPAPPAPPGGTIKVVTTNLQEGWLRKNGVPYSESATLTEYWDRVAFPNGDVWLTVTQIVIDPKYLTREYVTSMHFKKEADGTKWKPSPCRGEAPGTLNVEQRTSNQNPNVEQEAGTRNPERGTAIVDLAGSWAMANDEELLTRMNPGPELNNFTGFPLNAAGRQKALSWNSTIQAVPEHQARPHPAQYSMRGPGPNFHMGEIIEPGTRLLLAYTITGLFQHANRTIWLDGRPHPSPFAEHLWNGFSTGVWQNGSLKVTTTHMKQAFLQRNGIPSSPYGVMTEFFIRHGDRLLLVSQVDDPIYLEEPMIRTSTFKWNPGQREQPVTQVEIADELPDLKPGDVPHYPLGTRHTEYAEEHKLPYEATVGGMETLYPEYVEKLKQMMTGGSR